VQAHATLTPNGNVARLGDCENPLQQNEGATLPDTASSFLTLSDQPGGPRRDGGASFSFASHLNNDWDVLAPTLHLLRRTKDHETNTDGCLSGCDLHVISKADADSPPRRARGQKTKRLQYLRVARAISSEIDRHCSPVPVESSRQREIRPFERSDGEQRKWMGTHYELSLVVGHTSRVIPSASTNC
jgi:hypothetical protein